VWQVANSACQWWGGRYIYTVALGTSHPPTFSSPSVGQHGRGRRKLSAATRGWVKHPANTMAKATISVTVLPELRNNVLADDKRDGDKAGKRTGLRLVHFVTAMLAANEKAKASDEVLAATLAAEFPKRSHFQAIPTWRAYFNGQKHGLNANGRKSVRYGDDGQPARRAAPANGKAKGKAAGKGAKGSKGKASSKAKGKANKAAQVTEAAAE